jgi:hypothetical protein
MDSAFAEHRKWNERSSIGSVEHDGASARQHGQPALSGVRRGNAATGWKSMLRNPEPVELP